MASSIMVSLASSAAINRAAPPQVSMVAPFIGLRSTAAFPVTHKPSTDLSSLPSNSSRLQCVIIITRSPPGLKKFATLSSIHPLSPRALAKEVDYLLSMGWVPCLELNKIGFVYHENNRSPQYNDEYWTRWKLPMFGCTDSSQVLKELEEAKKAYPNFFIRITGFDNNRQVQCISFIAYKPPSF